MATDSTVRRILDAALDLFNERGVGVVSTRAIAERAGVSSGNLHYHFAGKEPIVRALLDRRDQLTDPVWAVPAAGPSLAGLDGMLRANLRLAWRYRFLNRELVTFTLGDQKFRADYTRLHARRIDQLRRLLHQLVDMGALEASASDLESALTAGWIISEHWLVHLETIGVDVTEERIAEGAGLVMRLLAPRTTDGAASAP